MRIHFLNLVEASIRHKKMANPKSNLGTDEQVGLQEAIDRVSHSSFSRVLERNDAVIDRRPLSLKKHVADRLTWHQGRRVTEVLESRLVGESRRRTKRANSNWPIQRTCCRQHLP